MITNYTFTVPESIWDQMTEEELRTCVRLMGIVTLPKLEAVIAEKEAEIQRLRTLLNE